MDKVQILSKIKSHYKFKSDAEFARHLGIKPQVLSNWKSRNSYDPELIYTNCLELNPAWLLTGNGPMISSKEYADSETGLHVVNEGVTPYNLRTDNTVSHQHIPLYNIEAAAGLVELFRNHNDESAVDTISIPNLPKCDGAVYVVGDSMYPLLKSGDIIMYKQVNNILDGLFWGEMYLVSVDMDGDEYIAVKFIQKSDRGDEYVKLVSQNNHHQPKDVKVQKIRALALIKASIRINSMH